jgi:hypothetical protein
MERQKNRNYGITILIKGISALIPLTTVANNFPRLAYIDVQRTTRLLDTTLVYKPKEIIYDGWF